MKKWILRQYATAPYPYQELRKLSIHKKERFDAQSVKSEMTDTMYASVFGESSEALGGTQHVDLKDKEAKNVGLTDEEAKNLAEVLLDVETPSNDLLSFVTLAISVFALLTSVLHNAGTDDLWSYIAIALALIVIMVITLVDRWLFSLAKNWDAEFRQALRILSK